MRIEILADGRVLEGTALQIVRDMQSIAFGQEDHSLSEYIDWIVDQAGRMTDVELKITGETDAEKAEALVREMIEKGLARRL